MNTIDGLVSTIIPVHNRPELLREAVRSVVEQEYRPIEVIVVDDGSTDETVEVADQLAATLREVQVVHRPRGGPGRAREAGRVRASGEFIQYLDSDDLLLPGKFAAQVAALRADPSAGVSYGKTRFVPVGGPPLTSAWKRTGERIETLFPSFLVERWWDTSTPLYRRTVTEAAGPWTPLSVEEDWEYDCRVAALGTRLCAVPEYVSETRENPERRLSEGKRRGRRKLRDRAAARELILDHASRGGLTSEDPEMRHFARSLFLLARQCGAAGLRDETERLFVLSRLASGPDLSEGLDFRLYALMTRLVGWERTGRIACHLDALRPGRWFR